MIDAYVYRSQFHKETTYAYAYGVCATTAHVLTKGVWSASWDTQLHESLDEAAVVASFNMQCVCISISAGSLSATFELASLSEL
eukprot:18115-Heterococcus_DN1.PRE.7